MTHEPSSPPNLSFRDIHKLERDEIQKRRARQSYAQEDGATPTFVGLALSGGGIRSATFCLGFLQGLHSLRLLRVFDYLSTVSGGGYLGGWWSAWLSRSEESLRDINAEPLFKLQDIHYPVSLLTKISEGADPVSQTLLAQLQDNTAGRSFLELLRRKQLTPSAQLSGLLVYHLNTYILKQLGSCAKAESKEEAARRVADLRWEARLRLIETFPCELRNCFPPPEKIEPDRPRALQEESSDGSSCAWADPIHHLRLFANYLTPRKGILSADTWRAISVIARNLAFTWLILLPLLIGVMLLGQAYFLLNPATTIAFAKPESPEVLSTAFIQILIPVGVLVISSILMSIAWLLCNRDNSSSQDSTVQTTCLLALTVLVVYAVASIDPLQAWFGALLSHKQYFFTSIRNSNLERDAVFSVILLRLIVTWAVLIFASILFMWHWKLDSNSFPIADSETLSRWKRDVRRSRFSRAQAKLLVTTAIVAAVLLLSLMSCFLAIGRLPIEGWKIPFTIVPLLSAIGGSIFTALRATPIPNANKEHSREPTRISKVIFATSPPLVVAVLAVIAAWFSHWLLVHYMRTGMYTGIDGATVVVPFEHFLEIRGFLKLTTILAIALCMGLALYEMQNLKWSKILRPAVAPILFICLLMSNLIWGGQAIFRYASDNPGPDWSFAFSGLIGVFITFLVFRRIIPRGKWKWRLFRRLNLVNKTEKGKRQHHLKILLKLRAGSVLAGLSLSVILALIGYGIGWIIYSSTSYEDKGALVRALVLTIVALMGGVILFRLLITRSRNAGEHVIKLYFFSENSFARQPWALWLVASICFTLPIVMLCVAHYVKWQGQSHPYNSLTEAPMLFPLCIGLLLASLMWLRCLVIQKSIVNRKPIASWSDGIFDWISGKVSRERKYPGAAHQLMALVAVCLAPVLEMMIRTLSRGQSDAPMMIWPINWKVSVVSLFVGLPVFGISVFKIPVRGNPYNVVNSARRRVLHSQTFLWILASFCILWAFLAALLFPNWLGHVSDITSSSGFATVLLPVASGCFLMVLFEFCWGRRDNRRSLYLAGFAYAAIASIFFVRLTGAGPEMLIVPGILAAICVWVGALGWMVDPNAVSMHQFYKGRLVRAYLGASNVRRLLYRTKEITETVAGDDLPLKLVRNCERGGPYHLLNTTLNLVAGRDLATAQRSASSFVLSQKYCGSARTNYCSTEEYMNGQLTLGTAVAASGAAVSPNMGAKKPTAALAMLMTLLNVRLGYWAPTPNREGWNSSQPRLWPFYLVREFLSQTNDLSDYCYLTDGGHFDNTGLYSLIERGCRYVVLVDCGADPKPFCFEDFGEAIRRCRIDFGTEIEVSLDPFIETSCGKGDQCFVVGKIHFSREHLLSLSQTTDDSFDDDSLIGTIVYFKPAVMESVTADVRQYAIENKNFPQQGTTNQWFDEAQFESYRRLGQLCANKAFNIKAVKDMKKSDVVLLRDIDKVFKGLGEADARKE